MRIRYVRSMTAAAAFVATALWAQAPAPASDTSQTAATAPSSTAPERMRNGGPADARVCLEFPTNLQVIQCAEKYRHLKPPA